MFHFLSFNYKTLRAIVWALQETIPGDRQYIMDLLRPLAEHHGYDLEQVVQLDLPDLPLEIAFLAGKNQSVGNEWYTVNNGLLEPGKMLQIEV